MSDTSALVILLATHNRRDTTRRCLQSIRRASAGWGGPIRLIVVDDGSTDGTIALLEGTLSSEDQLILGDGSLYWAGAMRRAMAALDTSPDPYEYFLLLNDDVVLFEDSLALFRRAVSGRADGIWVGDVLDPDTGQVTYGGVSARGPFRKLSFRLSPQGRPIDTFNANAVLVGVDAYGTLGHFDPRFRHALADFDYGLRARRHGVYVARCSRPVGTCSRHETVAAWQDPALTVAQRFREMLEPKGLPPKEWLHFCLRHAGLAAPIYLLSPWLKLLRGDRRGGRRP